MQCYRRSMKISYMEHVTNEMVLERVDQNRKLLAMVKTRKLKYFGHISRHTSLEKTSCLERCQASDKASRVSKWTDDLTEWSNKSIPEQN